MADEPEANVDKKLKPSLAVDDQIAHLKSRGGHVQPLLSR